jgi:hypothetical protein
MSCKSSEGVGHQRHDVTLRACQRHKLIYSPLCLLHYSTSSPTRPSPDPNRTPLRGKHRRCPNNAPPAPEPPAPHLLLTAPSSPIHNNSSNFNPQQSTQHSTQHYTQQPTCTVSSLLQQSMQQSSQQSSQQAYRGV